MRNMADIATKLMSTFFIFHLSLPFAVRLQILRLDSRLFVVNLDSAALVKGY
jgi:hypothetical protein